MQTIVSSALPPQCIPARLYVAEDMLCVIDFMKYAVVGLPLKYRLNTAKSMDRCEWTLVLSCFVPRVLSRPMDEFLCNPSL